MNFNQNENVKDKIIKYKILYSHIGGSKILIDKHISFLIYINLEHRKDRNEIILKMLKNTDIKPEKILRFNAIKTDVGWLGCLNSHLECAKILQEKIKNKEISGNVMVIEDDFKFMDNVSHVNSSLEYFFSKINDYDVLLLTSRRPKMLGENTHTNTEHQNIFKSLKCHDSGGYIINSKYIGNIYNLWNNAFKEASTIDIDINSHHHLRIDNVWTKLMAKDNWYFIKPPIAMQYTSFSDCWKSTWKSNEDMYKGGN
tara:strand:+ start:311 stop:1078 length:768 start_codon:yes stop_codon:yes gene_type:complete